MTMTPTQKITMLIDHINMIKRVTTQVEVGGICNKALERLSSHRRYRGRKKATGKYNTHEELIQQVLFYYYDKEQNQTQVAKTCQVSQTTVHNILEKYGPERREWI